MIYPTCRKVATTKHSFALHILKFIILASASKSKRAFFVFTIVVIAGVATLLFYALRRQALHMSHDFDEETVYRMYPGFGIGIPEGYSIHGIDVSRYQYNVNWTLVRKMKSLDIRLGFAFIKATEGTTIIDPSFNRNWRKSKEAGLVRGAYHFFRPGNSGKKQAASFIRQVKLRKGDLPPVLDIEVAGNADAASIAAKAKEWLNEVEAYYGVKPIIYTNPSFYNKYLGQAFDDYPLWVAHYQERKGPRIQRDWHFWQHNESGRVDGIKAFVDFNVFSGESMAFKKLMVP